MTKQEMMEKFYAPKDNYGEAQRRIKEAMEKGEPYVLLPGKHGPYEDGSWVADVDTILHLKDDGFDIDEVWNAWEYWSVEWGY